jgi:hypothetical protein
MFEVHEVWISADHSVFSAADTEWWYVAPRNYPESKKRDQARAFPGLSRAEETVGPAARNADCGLLRVRVVAVCGGMRRSTVVCEGPSEIWRVLYFLSALPSVLPFFLLTTVSVIVAPSIKLQHTIKTA